MKFRDVHGLYSKSTNVFIGWVTKTSNLIKKKTGLPPHPSDEVTGRELTDMVDLIYQKELNNVCERTVGDTTPRFTIQSNQSHLAFIPARSGTANVDGLPRWFSALHVDAKDTSPVRWTEAELVDFGIIANNTLSVATAMRMLFNQQVSLNAFQGMPATVFASMFKMAHSMVSDIAADVRACFPASAALTSIFALLYRSPRHRSSQKNS
ncbi:hypothetical protein B0T16DRAFT_394809 [Cercophora newfieldiana]|uniref:Uncharacterized protein n=1 Tax=Cercophora newfieldiana TaxID=92897 RepID=A0AA39XRQ1_9PEZI|nr:hypothetical protein B0T16DRAFT_394809 [Cercophora newfieldiana]